MADVVKGEVGAPSLATEYQAAALMLASGKFSQAEIAETTGVSTDKLSILERSPLFQTAVTRFKDRLYAEHRDRLMADLMADAAENLEFIRLARRGEVQDTPAMLSKRLVAALALFDRALPHKVDAAPAAAVQVVINADTAQRFERAFAEAKAVPAVEDEE